MERPLTIAIICHPAVGGSGVVAAELGLGLAARGHEVHIVSHRRPIRVTSPEPEVHFHEVAVTRYPLFTYPPYTLALATKLVEISREHPIDVLHAHYAIPHAVSAYLAKQMLGDQSPKIVTTLHGTDITLLGLDPSFFEITRFSLEQSDGLTAVSDYLARETREKFGVTRPIETIHNFIDSERFTPARRSPDLRARYADKDEALIGHLSNFRWVKRTIDAVKAFHRVVQHMAARLLMIGDGPDLEATRMAADELGILDRVTFLGAEQEVEAILPQLDAFLLPSEQESFGLAALEAMSCGVPVVATNVGGVPELVDAGGSGYLCEVGDVDTMAARICEILEDPALKRRLSDGARARALQFAEEPGISRYERYYRRTLAR